MSIDFPIHNEIRHFLTVNSYLDVDNLSENQINITAADTVPFILRGRLLSPIEDMRSPYRLNALFLLDARADASIPEIRRLQNRAEVLLEMGKGLESTVLPIFRRNQTTREDIRPLLQRVEKYLDIAFIHWIILGNLLDRAIGTPLDSLASSKISH